MYEYSWCPVYRVSGLPWYYCSSSNKMTLKCILDLVLNRGVLEKDENKVKIVSCKSEQEGFSAQLRQYEDSAEIRMVRMRASYQEMSKSLGSRQFEDV